MQKFPRIIGILIATNILFSVSVLAQESAPVADSQDGTVDVEQLKQKYWAKGNDAELRVVQNRAYTKANKIELGLFGSTIASDPFLSIKALGGSIGYYFSEYVSAKLIGFKDFVSPSSALRTFEATQRTTANSNYPRGFLGAQADWNPLYGKLSLFGNAIVYFDFHVGLGAGVRFTETGNYAAPLASVGQQVFLSKRFAINLEYRLIYYKESIQEKAIASRLGNKVGERRNFNDVFSLGVTFFIL